MSTKFWRVIFFIQVTWFRSVESVGNNEGSTGRKHLQVIPSNRVGTLVMSNGLKHVLRFKSVQDSDLGIYTCKAENPHGQAEAAIEMSGNKNKTKIFSWLPLSTHVIIYCRVIRVYCAKLISFVLGIVPIICKRGVACSRSSKLLKGADSALVTILLSPRRSILF
jgi:hypothetical protein